MHFFEKKVGKKFASSKIISTFATANKPRGIRPDGGIGRRAGLKHQWSNPSRFDPGSGYKELQIERFVALFLSHRFHRLHRYFFDAKNLNLCKSVRSVGLFSLSPPSRWRHSSYFTMMLLHYHFDSIYNINA